ncbi:MAG: hypothetical protein BWK77_01065 [Verrucomicrobia bacterium A1]|nr:MAG: hypothetical protein BWK77_01065 [Verrucomicrobia bacterium A1]
MAWIAVHLVDADLRAASGRVAICFFLRQSSRMKTTLLSAAVAVLMLGSAFADQDTILPFAVKLGGQDAMLAEKDAIYAAVSQPVAADAEIVTDTTDDTVFVNVFAADEKGNALPEAVPAVLILRKGPPAKLSQTADGQPLSPGRYIMNVVSPAKGTARVFFRVGE